MITKTILGDQWIANRNVSANFHLAAFDDSGNEILRSNPHVVCLTPGADVAAIFAAVNADITTREGLKWPPIEQADWDRLTAHCGIEQTPDVVAAYLAFVEKQNQSPVVNSAAAQL